MINRRQADRNAQAYAHAMSTAEQERASTQQYAPPPSPMPSHQEDMIAQLECLGALKAQGVLAEEELVAAKQKLLAVG